MSEVWAVDEEVGNPTEQSNCTGSLSNMYLALEVKVRLIVLAEFGHWPLMSLVAADSSVLQMHQQLV